MAHPNPQNLRTPTSDEAREIGAKGGKASAASRRKQKNIREAINSLLSQKLKEGHLQDDPGVKVLIERFGLTDDDKVTALAAASILSALLAGSPQHAKLVVDMTANDGEKSSAPTKIVVAFDDNSERTEV